VYFYTKSHGIDVGVDYLTIIFFLLTLQFLNFWVCYRYLAQTQWRDVLLCSIATLSYAAAFIFVYSPIDLYVDRARQFVIAIENLRAKSHANLIFYRENPDGMPIKYLINMPQLAQPIFINQPHELLRAKAPAFIVTHEAYFSELPKDVLRHIHIIARDKLGHVNVVVLMQNGRS
jgi:hypothetical protein